MSNPSRLAANAGRLIAAFRRSGEPIVHLQHVWDAPDATFMRPGTSGIEFHESVAPEANELVIQKIAPNGFLQTNLETELRTRDVQDLVVVGMMSSMCVDATVRAAVDLGFGVSVAHDACAAPDLEFGDATIPGPTVHAAFMAALKSGYASVAATDDLT